MSIEAHGELVPVGGGDTIPLIRDELVVGRRESCDIFLNYPNVSSQHCRLQFQDGYWYIADMNSTNGVKVNGERVVRKLLHPSDKITIAKREFIINYQLQAGRRAMEELEDEDVLGTSLLEKAGLEKAKPRDEPPRFRNDDDDVETIQRNHTERRPATE
jgi:pSer/pThr/pTyr-binding forkhead associated (FHA) protein